jgi:hypothetical protein
MNPRATHFIATGNQPVGSAARRHPISPAPISAKPVWFLRPDYSENKSTVGIPSAGTQTQSASTLRRVKTHINQKFFALKEPIYEGIK